MRGEQLDAGSIISLLAPFARLNAVQVSQVAAYLGLLLRWNAATNLTAVRLPSEMVTRHFGESFFLARHALPSREDAGAQAEPRAFSVMDIGSGAGFPGLPLKIARPNIHLLLVESHHKKATFLKEVVRRLELRDVEVIAARAENFQRQADLVCLRAVERFPEILPVAAERMARGGRLALLISRQQEGEAKQALPQLSWLPSISIPQSTSRVLLLGTKPSSE